MAAQWTLLPKKLCCEAQGTCFFLWGTQRQTWGGRRDKTISQSPRGSAKLNPLVEAWHCSAGIGGEKTSTCINPGKGALHLHTHPCNLPGDMKEGKIPSTTQSVLLLTFIESRRVK